MSVFQAWLTTNSIRFRIRALKALLRDSRAEFAAIRRHLRPGDIACDIGVNKGSFIYWLSWWVGDGRVVAFEPQADLARELANTCRAIGLGNVTVEAKAVYSHSGRHDLFLPVGHQPGASLMRGAVQAESVTTVSVPLVALDDYFDPSDKIAMLKIDVEGAELEVIEGMRRTIAAHHPVILCEMHGKNAAFASLMESLGYSVRTLENNLPLAEARWDVHAVATPRVPGAFVSVASS
jgi:FkbM family methyltransferase